MKRERDGKTLAVLAIMMAPPALALRGCSKGGGETMAGAVRKKPAMRGCYGGK
jgi:hypothetical protein